MNRHKIVSYLFLLLTFLVIVGSSYVIILYAADMLNAIVTFVTGTDYSKLQQCGITPPAQFSKLKTEFTTLVLPALYIGLPILLILVSALMFLSGFYYQRGRTDDDIRKQEQMEREMVHKLVRKMSAEKNKPNASVESTEEQEIVEVPSEETVSAPQIVKRKK